LLLDLDGLPAGVVPAVGAHPMRQLRLVALRAFRVRRRRGLPVGRTLAAFGLRGLALRGRHGLMLLSVGSRVLEGRPSGVGLHGARAFVQVAIAAASLAEAEALRPAER